MCIWYIKNISITAPHPFPDYRSWYQVPTCTKASRGRAKFQLLSFSCILAVRINFFIESRIQFVDFPCHPETNNLKCPPDNAGLPIRDVATPAAYFFSWNTSYAVQAGEATFNLNGREKSDRGKVDISKPPGAA